MSHSPDREIEKLLKAAGKRRQQDVGDPVMHPALREVLQTEVHRQYRESDGASSQLFAWLKPARLRLALGVSLALLAGVAALTLTLPSRDDGLQLAYERVPEAISDLRTDRPELSGRRGGSVGNEVADTERAALLQPSLETSEPVATLASAPQSVGPAERRPKSEQTYPSLSNRYGAAEELSMDTRSKDLPTVRLSEGNKRMNGFAAATTDAASRPTDDMARQPRPTDTVAGITLAESRPVDESAISGQAQRARLSAPASLPVAATTARQLALATEEPPSIAVLQRFRVEMDGHHVRFVDLDGSAYTGTAQMGKARTFSYAGGDAFKEKGASQLMKRNGVYTGRENLAEAEEALKYFFTVSGTNRSLAQPVVFEGSMTAVSVGKAQSPTWFSNALLPGQDLRGDLESPILERLPGQTRIVGRAVVGSSAEVEVDAVLVRP